MPEAIAMADVQRLIGEGAQLAEVLPREEYDWAHIAGAIHLPLKELSRDRADATLDRSRPVIVYCHDTA